MSVNTLWNSQKMVQVRSKLDKSVKLNSAEESTLAWCYYHEIGEVTEEELRACVARFAAYDLRWRVFLFIRYPSLNNYEAMCAACGVSQGVLRKTIKIMKAYVRSVPRPYSKRDEYVLNFLVEKALTRRFRLFVLKQQKLAKRF